MLSVFWARLVTAIKNGGAGTISGPQARDPRPTNPVPTGRLLKSYTSASTSAPASSTRSFR